MLRLPRYVFLVTSVFSLFSIGLFRSLSPFANRPIFHLFSACLLDFRLYLDYLTPSSAVGNRTSDRRPPVAGIS